MYKFKQGFQDSLDLICSCGNDIKTSAYFLLHYLHYSNKSSTFLNTIGSINRNLFDKNDLQITETLLYGDSFLGDKNNTPMLNAIIDFFLSPRDLTLAFFKFYLFIYLFIYLFCSFIFSYYFFISRHIS